MELFIISFVAGVLTVAAPCILPLLPVVVGGSIARNIDEEESKNWQKPLVVAVSLGVSVILFTLLFKATTALLGIPASVWAFISGGIILLLGVTFAFPEMWLRFAAKLHIESGANSLLKKGTSHNSFTGDIITGFALGPVFNSCSPTYLLIVATILPASFATGFAYLVAYAVGLSGTLLVISYFGQGAVKKLGWIANAQRLKRVVGVLFILVGLFVIFGLDKKVQTYVLEQGWYDPVSRIEQSQE